MEANVHWGCDKFGSQGHGRQDLLDNAIYQLYKLCQPHVLEDFLKGFPHYKSVEAKL